MEADTINADSLSMTSSDPAWYLSHNAPAVLEWQVDDNVVYLGFERP